MKILVTGTRGVPNILGGVESHCEELFPRIAQQGHQVYIIRRKSYTNDNLKEYKGIQLIDIDCPKKKSFEAIIHTWKAIRRAHKMKVDIVHIHAIGPALLTPLARLLGLKVIFTHHGPDYDREKWGIAAKFMLKLGERMGCKFANEMIVISEVIAKIVADKYNRRDTHLIYNGVPAPHFIESSSYMEELNLQTGKYIFAMGRFVPEKNFHHLINAFSQINDPHYKLVLAGDADFEDDYSRKLKQLAKEKGVVLTGFIKGEKLQSLLTHARLFVLPSSHEGLPISLLEAMSYCLPVIVSDIPANLAVRLPKEFYYPVGNEKALAKRIKTTLRMKEEKISYNMQSYNWDNIAEQVGEIYKKMKF